MQLFSKHCRIGRSTCGGIRRQQDFSTTMCTGKLIHSGMPLLAESSQMALFC